MRCEPTSQDGLHFGNISQHIRVDSICLVVPLPSFSMTTRITTKIFRRPGDSNLSIRLICRYYWEVGQLNLHVVIHKIGAPSWELISNTSTMIVGPESCNQSSDQMPCLFSLQRQKIGKQGTKWQSLSGSTSKTDQK